MNSRQKHIIRSFKGLESGPHKALTISDQDGVTIGQLQPVNHRLANDAATIHLLTAWRQKFMKAFLTQFQATPERTQAWLNNSVLPQDDRILFLILDDVGKAVGNFGVANITERGAELDNVIRGEKVGDARLVYFSELSLMHWLYKTLEVEDIYLRVFSANRRAIALYEAVGFRTSVTTRLLREDRDGETYYVIDSRHPPSDGDALLYTMTIDRQLFQTLHAWLAHGQYPREGAQDSTEVAA